MVWLDTKRFWASSALDPERGWPWSLQTCAGWPRASALETVTTISSGVQGSWVKWRIEWLWTLPNVFVLCVFWFVKALSRCQLNLF